MAEQTALRFIPSNCLVIAAHVAPGNIREERSDEGFAVGPSSLFFTDVFPPVYATILLGFPHSRFVLATGRKHYTPFYYRHHPRPAYELVRILK